MPVVVRWSALVALLVGLVIVATVATRDVRQSNPGFYGGKTLRIVTGSSLGGGFDVEARLLARHLARHIPGAPRVVVENTPGAGGLLAANLVARGKPDGLTLGYFTLALPMAQLARNPAVQFDVRQFEFVGAPYDDPALCFFSKASGITTFQQWQAAKRPPILGATAPDSITGVIPAVLSAAFGLPMRVISGYKGAAELRLALAGGEVDGMCLGAGGTNAGWPTRSGITVVIRSGRSDVDQKTTPLAIDLASTTRQRELMGVIDLVARVSRTYAFAPGTPANRRDIIRRAFADTMRDPSYVAEARASSIGVDPLTGDAIAEGVRRLLSLPPSLAGPLTQGAPR